VMFVIEQMQLIKCRACDLPMMFLVHVSQRNGILVSGSIWSRLLDARLADILRQGNGQSSESSVGLNLYRVLIHVCSLKRNTRETDILAISIIKLCNASILTIQTYLSDHSW
jgi:hypothetical protein